MSDFLNTGARKFAPQPQDSIRELRSKAEEMLEHLRENETFLRQFPTGAVDERRALWRPLVDLLAQAMSNPELVPDARLEAQRVWAEEMHLSALITVTMCVHARSEAAKQRFADHPEMLEALWDQLEQARPAALKLITADELTQLRAHGFLREGE